MFRTPFSPFSRNISITTQSISERSASLESTLQGLQFVNSMSAAIFTPRPRKSLFYLLFYRSRRPISRPVIIRWAGHSRMRILFSGWLSGKLLLVLVLDWLRRCHMAGCRYEQSRRITFSRWLSLSRKLLLVLNYLYSRIKRNMKSRGKLFIVKWSNIK